MKLLRIAFLACLAGFALLLAWTIVQAQLTESVFVGGPRLAAQPWGWVTILDVYLGFVVFGTYLAVREGSWRRALPWLVAISVLGNVATAAYLLWVLHRHGYDWAALLRRDR